jgi:hypothetical protein
MWHVALPLAFLTRVRIPPPSPYKVSTSGRGVKTTSESKKTFVQIVTIFVEKIIGTGIISRIVSHFFHYLPELIIHSQG